MSGFVLSLLSKLWLICLFRCLFSEFNLLPALWGYLANFLCLFLILFTLWTQVRFMGILVEVQFPAGKVAGLCEAPEEIFCSHKLAQQRDLPSPSLIRRQEVSTWGISSHSSRAWEAQRSSKDHMWRRHSTHSGTTDLWGPWSSTTLAQTSRLLPRLQTPAPAQPPLVPGRAWGSQPSILLTCKPSSHAPRTAGRWFEGGRQGGHQKCSPTANFPESCLQC